VFIQHPTATTRLRAAEYAICAQRSRPTGRAAEDLWVETAFGFCTDADEPIDPRNPLRALEVARRTAKLKDATLHTLRRSAASVMLTKWRADPGGAPRGAERAR